MNEHLRPDRLPATTQAAEGLPRRRWTVAELEAMVAKGIISEDERFELIGGEVVPMCPKGARHEILRSELAFHMTQRAGAELRVVAEAQLNLTDDAYVLPDILVHPAAIKVPYVRGTTALLVIEIADSSLGYDQQTKAPLYASYGVQEYWVINAKTLLTTVYCKPSGSEYSQKEELTAEERLVPEAAPGLAVTLRDLDLVTSIHREPGPEGYPDPRKAGAGELLEPLLAPQLAVRLNDLGLTPAT
jgi:Uma2 family endonuclease